MINKSEWPQLNDLTFEDIAIKIRIDLSNLAGGYHNVKKG